MTNCCSCRAVLAWVLACLISQAGCLADSPTGVVPLTPEPAETRVLFELSDADPAQDLYALPYPNDLRLRADGTIDLARLGAGQGDLLQPLLDAAADNLIGGFSLNGAVFFRFSGPIDPAGLPRSPEDSLAEGASVFLVNVQAGSPHYGQRIPLLFSYTEEAGNYIGPYALALMPVPGFSLEPLSRYAAIVTDAVTDASGVALALHPTLEALLADRAPVAPELEEAYRLYAPLREHLAQRSQVVRAATVFTTGDPVRLAGRVRQAIFTEPPPQAEALKLTAANDRYLIVEGTYSASNFQSGTAPYFRPADGGAILHDAAGVPQVAKQETLRFALTVPRGAVPPSGWPIVLYAHGTGGDYRSFIRSNVANLLAQVKDETGGVVGQLAVAGIDQNLHGTRSPEGNSPELTFFNFQNPLASVSNVIQSGADNISLLRMIEQLEIAEVPLAEPRDGQQYQRFDPPLRFDPQRVGFMGHSQGAITGPVFLAHEPQVRAVVLSGGGALAILSLLEKTQPVSIPSLLKLAFNEEPDLFHPLLALLQQLLEPVDTINYAPLLARRPLEGVGPKHLLITQGLIDHYTPNSTGDALATAAGLSIAEPVLRSVEGVALRGMPALSPPIRGNLSVVGQLVTAAFVQYSAQPMGGSCAKDPDCGGGYCEAGQCVADGHFVVFDDARAIRQYTRFFAAMVQDELPTIVP